jgi:hypothetical protein
MCSWALPHCGQPAVVALVGGRGNQTRPPLAEAPRGRGTVGGGGASRGPPQLSADGRGGDGAGPTAERAGGERTGQRKGCWRGGRVVRRGGGRSADCSLGLDRTGHHFMHFFLLAVKSKDNTNDSGQELPVFFAV